MISVPADIVRMPARTLSGTALRSDKIVSIGVVESSGQLCASVLALFTYAA